MNNLELKQLKKLKQFLELRVTIRIRDETLFEWIFPPKNINEIIKVQTKENK